MAENGRQHHYFYLLLPRRDVLKELGISRHQLYYALLHVDPDDLDPDGVHQVWGRYSTQMVEALRKVIEGRELRQLPEPVRYLMTRGRSESAARRWLQRHPGAHPREAPVARARQ